MERRFRLLLLKVLGMTEEEAERARVHHKIDVEEMHAVGDETGSMEADVRVRITAPSEMFGDLIDLGGDELD